MLKRSCIIVLVILKPFLKVGKETVRNDRRRDDRREIGSAGRGLRNKTRKRPIEDHFPKDFSDGGFGESSDSDVVFVKMVSKV